MVSISPKLLEHLISQIADKLLAKYPCQKVTISVAKPTAIESAEAVGVQVTRYAQSAVKETDIDRELDDSVASQNQEDWS